MTSIVPPHSDQNKLLFIRVLELRPIHPPEGEPPGNLKAFCKVQVGPFIIYANRIIQVHGQRPYVQLPMREGKGGKYYPVLSCDDPGLGERIKVAILAAWAAYQGGPEVVQEVLL